MAKKNRVLTTDTYVTNPENGQSEVFKAGTAEAEIPEIFLDKINNESVWGDSGTEGDDVAVEDYASMSQKDLVALVKERELDSPTTNKSDLITVLENADLTKVGSNAKNDPSLQ